MAENASKQTPREFLIEFIELYRSFTCLWLVRSKEYSDRNKKDLAYIELVKKFKEFDPSADRNTVVKKINALRTVYKKELSKVKSSEKSGAGADDIYKPSLWYFDLLHFLNDQDFARPSRNTMSDVDAVTQQDEDSEPTDQDHFQRREINTPAPPTSGDDGSSASTSVAASPMLSRPKRKKNMTPADEVIHLAGEQLKGLRPDDEFEAFGKYIAHKLRSLKGNQSVFARKLINDVIFEGELEALNKGFKVMDSQPHRSLGNDYVQFHPPSYLQRPHPPPSISQIPNHQLSQLLTNQYSPEQADSQQPITQQPEPQQHTDSNYTSHSASEIYSKQLMGNNVSTFFKNFSE